MEDQESIEASQVATSKQTLPEGRYTRLLELAPGNRHDRIVVRMFVIPLSEAPDYSALSYVWGNAEETAEVLCYGLSVVTTVNLGAALRRVRYEHKPRIIWADAICIDQSNVRERGHQVAVMGKIFEQTKIVFVCLGPDLDGGASGVAALVKENADLVSRYGSVPQMPIVRIDDPLLDDSRWKAMATSADCEWFSRAWVIQEVGLASDPRALYGDVEFSYRELTTLARWVANCASHLTPLFGLSF
jgi:hypothetical protein